MAGPSGCSQVHLSGAVSRAIQLDLERQATVNLDQSPWRTPTVVVEREWFFPKTDALW